MKYLIAALAVAGLALGIAPTAGATTIAAFCTNHQEYLGQPAAALQLCSIWEFETETGLVGIEAAGDAEKAGFEVEFVVLA